MTRLSPTAIRDEAVRAGLPEYVAEDIAHSLAAPGETAPEQAVEFAIDLALREMAEF